MIVAFAFACLAVCPLAALYWRLCCLVRQRTDYPRFIDHQTSWRADTAATYPGDWRQLKDRVEP